jgi:hypothetical protein
MPVYFPVGCVFALNLLTQSVYKIIVPTGTVGTRDGRSTFSRRKLKTETSNVYLLEGVYKMKHQLFTYISMILLGAFLSAPSASGDDNKKTYPVSSQVGMYSYRVKGLTGYISKDSKDQIKKTVKIKRNEKGEVIAKTHYNPDGRIELKYEYKFDDKNRLIKKIKQSPEGKPIRILNYFYDDHNLAFKQTDTDADGAVIKTHFYSYNPKGERIRKRSLDAKGNLKTIKLYIFDTENRRIKDYSMTPEGNITGNTKYIYDGEGKLKQTKSYKKNRLSGTTTISRDNSGKIMVKKSFDADNNLKSSLYYTYE